ncbi:unnamed protein product [Scytosiphon promiscuus]
MEPSSNESTPVYFCHVCMSRVGVRKTSTQELECRRCEQTFVEELLESVVGNAALAGGTDGGVMNGQPSSDTAGARTAAAGEEGSTGSSGGGGGGEGGLSQGLPMPVIGMPFSMLQALGMGGFPPVNTRPTSSGEAYACRRRRRRRRWRRGRRQFQLSRASVPPGFRQQQQQRQHEQQRLSDVRYRS